jgi:hypothetical protein
LPELILPRSFHSRWSVIFGLVRPTLRGSEDDRVFSGDVSHAMSKFGGCAFDEGGRWPKATSDIGDGSPSKWSYRQ